MLSLGKNSKMLRHTVESTNICVLSQVQSDKATIQTSLVTQGCSGQNVHTTKNHKKPREQQPGMVFGLQIS